MPICSFPPSRRCPGFSNPAALCVSFYRGPNVDLFMAAWRAAGFRPVSHIVFRKPFTSRTGFMKGQHETAYLLAKGNVQRPVFPPPAVLDCRNTGNLLHPTQKPVEALKPLIAAFCPATGIVLDPLWFGSTLVAATELCRGHVGIDIEGTHCRTAARRLEIEQWGAP
jgi:adenine-specific DNA-methyltransferase